MLYRRLHRLRVPMSCLQSFDLNRTRRHCYSAGSGSDRVFSKRLPHNRPVATAPGTVSKSRNRLIAPEGLRILAGGASHRKRRSKSYIAPAGATDPLINVYCRICRPAPFQGARIWLPQPRWLAPPANIPRASGARAVCSCVYGVGRFV